MGIDFVLSVSGPKDKEKINVIVAFGVRNLMLDGIEKISICGEKWFLCPIPLRGQSSWQKRENDDPL